MKIFNVIFKFILMIPVFVFIGCGILISLDIIQPSMFNNIGKNGTIFLISGLVGCSPLLLVNSTIKSLTNFYNKGFKSGLLFAIIIAIIFMATESVYSYISLKTIYLDQAVPTIKILGILALPFTFSLFYLSKSILDELEGDNICLTDYSDELNDLNRKIAILEDQLDVEKMALKISPDYYNSKTKYDIDRDKLINKIIEKGLSMTTQK